MISGGERADQDGGKRTDDVRDELADPPASGSIVEADGAKVGKTAGTDGVRDGADELVGLIRVDGAPGGQNSRGAEQGDKGRGVSAPAATWHDAALSEPTAAVAGEPAPAGNGSDGRRDAGRR